MLVYIDQTPETNDTTLLVFESCNGAGMPNVTTKLALSCMVYRVPFGKALQRLLGSKHHQQISPPSGQLHKKKIKLT